MSMQATAVPRTQTDMKRSVSSLHEHDGPSSPAENGADVVRDNSQYSTAGLFICKATDKPLPLSSQRSIPLPGLPRFWRLSSSSYKEPKAAPDILRRTGSSSSTYSRESTEIYSNSTPWVGTRIERKSTPACDDSCKINSHTERRALFPKKESRNSQRSDEYRRLMAALWESKKKSYPKTTTDRYKPKLFHMILCSATQQQQQHTYIFNLRDRLSLGSGQWETLDFSCDISNVS